VWLHKHIGSRSVPRTAGCAAGIVWPRIRDASQLPVRTENVPTANGRRDARAAEPPVQRQPPGTHEARHRRRGKGPAPRWCYETFAPCPPCRVALGCAGCPRRFLRPLCPECASTSTATAEATAVDGGVAPGGALSSTRGGAPLFRYSPKYGYLIPYLLRATTPRTF
jgi:hypothetical protein